MLTKNNGGSGGGGGTVFDSNAQDCHESQSLLSHFSKTSDPPQCKQNRSPNRNKSYPETADFHAEATAEFSALNGSSPHQSQDDGPEDHEQTGIFIEVPKTSAVSPCATLGQMPPKIEHPLNESPGGQVVRLAAYYAVGFLLSFPLILVACLALLIALIFRFFWHFLRTRSFAQFHFFPADCDWSLSDCNPTSNSECIQQSVITLQGDFPLADVRQLLWRRLVNAKSENARLLYPKYCRNSKIS